MRSLASMRQQRDRRSLRQGNRRAAALIECAITLPVLMVLVLGILEIGMALRASTIMQSACRESGQLTSIDWRYIVHENQTPNQKVTQDLKNFLTAAGLKGDKSTVRITHADGHQAGKTFDLADRDNDLELVRIQVTLPYSTVGISPLTSLGKKSLKASIVMRAAINGGSLSD